MKTLASKVVYRNPWMTVREDDIERDDGSRGVYGVVEKEDFVLVIPVSENDVYLVRQYRYPVKQRFWEFPQGAWEHRPGTAPETVARGELQEETGLIPGRLEHLGFLYKAYGYSTQGFHVFVATELQQGTRIASPEEQDMEVGRVPFARIEHMIRLGDIRDAGSVAAYSLLIMRR